MLPPDEASRIVLLISDAFTFAANGRVARGYMMLRDALQDGREWTPDVRGEAQALVEAALERFKERFPTEWYPEA